MKKFLLGIILFVAVVAASYLKVSYSSQEKRRQVTEFEQQRSADSLRALAKVDSLGQLLEQSRLSLDEFMAEQEQTEGRGADSLGRIIEKQSSRITRLTEDLKSAQKKITKLRVKNKPTKRSESGIDEGAIAKYYKSRIEKLPSDLSDYERRVMIEEIGEKTISRFSITPDQFDRILKERKLDL